MPFIICRKLLTIISSTLYQVWNIISTFRFLEVILDWGCQSPTLNLFVKTVGQESKNGCSWRIGEHFSEGHFLSSTLYPNSTLVLNTDLHLFYLVRLPVFVYACVCTRIKYTRIFIYTYTFIHYYINKILVKRYNHINEIRRIN